MRKVELFKLSNAQFRIGRGTNFFPVYYLMSYSPHLPLIGQQPGLSQKPLVQPFLLLPEAKIIDIAMFT